MNEKKHLQYALILGIMTLTLSQCHRYIYKNRIVNVHKNNNYYDQEYKKNKNKNYYKCFINDNFNNNLFLKSTKNNLKTTNYCFSEIHINNNSLNLLNTYLINNKEFIFNQLNLQSLDGKIIYNFGIGHRKSCHKNWIIGNNIFYDKTMSMYKPRFISIGHEIFKAPIYITTNTYHNTSNNNVYSPITSYKKYLPVACDLRIKIPLPRLKMVIGKVDFEYHLKQNQNYAQSILQHNIYTKNNHKHSNLYKLKFGVNYTPISIFTFNIDKTIYNSIQNHETTFNVTANYTFNISKITNIINNIQDINHTDIFSINNNYEVNRNNNMLLNYINNNLDITKKVNIITNYSDGIQLLNNIFSNNKNINLSIIDDIENKYMSTVHAIIIAPPRDLEITQQAYQINSTYSSKANSEERINNIPDSINKINDDTIKISSNDNLSIFSIPNNSLKNFKQNDINHQKMHQLSPSNNIPPPPPLPVLSTPTHTNITTQQTNQKEQLTIDTNTNNHNDYQNNIILTQIQNINQHKQKKFSSLGSEKHLTKLNDITKKRKKTISTGSTNSNNSDIATILKIIERQNISETDSDNTDNDEKNSIMSNNEFSDN